MAKQSDTFQCFRSMTLRYWIFGCLIFEGNYFLRNVDNRLDSGAYYFP